MRISRRPDFPAHLTTSIDPGRPAAKKVTATRTPVHCHHAQPRSTRARLLPTLSPSRCGTGAEVAATDGPAMDTPPRAADQDLHAICTLPSSFLHTREGLMEELYNRP
jgi:hypothetical protein